VFLSIRSKPPAVAPGKEPELAVSGHCDSEGKLWIRLRSTCVYYCSTYYKAVRVGGGDIGDMCYERRRAEACVD
jgi:hypothetical protein